LTKKPPITVARKANYFDWLVAHQKDNAFEVLAPANVPPLPEALRDVVRRMLSRSPDDRPQSYEEILDVLDRVQRGLPPELELDPLALRTLPAPVEGRIGSSNPSLPFPSPPVARFTSAESPASVEASQQKRWPDLDVPVSPTERFVPLPTPPSPAIPASPLPSANTETSEIPSDVSPAVTEQPPPPASPDATITAPTVVSERSETYSEISMWTGGAAEDSLPEPVSSSSDVVEEKTERLDDVIAKLRQQSSREPLPPLKLPSTPESLYSAPPSQPVRRPESAPASKHASERTTAAPPKPSQRLVVYGEPPPVVTEQPRRSHGGRRHGGPQIRFIPRPNEGAAMTENRPGRPGDVDATASSPAP